MIAARPRGADVVLASWVMVSVKPAPPLPERRRRLRRCAARSASRRTRSRRSSASTARPSCAARSGTTATQLIRERGFACKAEILAKLAHIGATITEVPVDLDSTRRVGKSKMPILKTMLAYWRLLARARFARGLAPG